jgi:hypothetical protein
MQLDFSAARACLASEPRVVRLPEEGKAVFVGDTHGDVETTLEVIRRYFKPGYTLVFLGDYVDRGRSSRENITLLLGKKLEPPDRIFLRMGYHEGYPFQELWPAEFWSSLSEEESQEFGEVFGLLPYMAASSNGLLAVHGVPPLLMKPGGLQGVEGIVPGSDDWHNLTWGDFTESSLVCDFNPAWGRPTYNGAYFDSVMSRYGKRVLIRATSQAFPISPFPGGA